MVAADINTNNSAVASSMLSSPNRRSVGTRSGSIAARRLPPGAPNTAQQNRSAAITSEPYFGDLGVRHLTAVGRNACINALRA